MFELSSSDRKSLDAFLQELVQIPSLSGQEKAIARRIEQEMRQVGFDDVWIDRSGNVVGRVGPGTGNKLLYVAHMDTVGVGSEAAWSHPPFAGRKENGVLYGRGAVDVKGSLASVIYGAKALVDSGMPLAGDVYVALVVLEEIIEGRAVQSLIEDEGVLPSWVVVAEPSNLQINRGQRGRLEMEVTVQGQSSHAAIPEQGQNAIYGAARVIFALELLAATLAEDPLLGKGTLAVTNIENLAGGRSVVPDLCKVTIDRRLTLGETEERALAEVEGVMARERVRGQVRVVDHEATTYTGYVHKGRGYYPAWLIEENHQLVDTMVKSAQKITGFRPKIGCSALSASGVYTMGQAGIPTIGFGPGQEQYAHTADERIRLEECYTAARIYARFAADLIGLRGSSP
ncbi:MAG: YgeY family selenium metabolism-linked hydrolase [Anaerolineae bacterium]